VRAGLANIYVIPPCQNAGFEQQRNDYSVRVFGSGNDKAGDELKA
jgi:hypothetical protein